MRQVFSSPRLENVEKVARLLEDAGIEARITDGRSYKGNRRRNFSYGGAGADAKPAVWVVRSDDQIRARTLLRDAGLLDSTRPTDSYLAPTFRAEPAAGPRKPGIQSRAMRIKLVLLGGIAIGVAFMVHHMLTNRPPQQEAAGPFDGSISPTLLPVARAVFEHELPSARLPTVCLAIDGKDAPQAMLEALYRQGRVVAPASACIRNPDEDRGSYHLASGREALMLDIARFRPTAPDAGEVEYIAYHHRMFGDYKTLRVQRVDGRWQVTGVVRHVSS
ncbi:hypothetical protein [Lysobacter sp. A3-1-A15]|uniref:hypothetical protein n=1 Tax=Novilysobacter viscosus TaxID=3098602 RepID=UPI002EDB8756